MTYARLPALLLALLAVAPAHADPIPPGERLSGAAFMSRETRTMQEDDFANPGMLWVREGEALWAEKAGAAARACADCHGAAEATMKGVAARYPAWESRDGRPVDLLGRINLCRVRHQEAAPLAWESRALLALGTHVAAASRGEAIAPDPDPRLAPHRAEGRALYETRIGQLDLACTQCHDAQWGRRLAGNPIPQAHPTGYPLYRLEWQAVGSRQRRLRNCMTGVRAEPFAYGDPAFIAIELYLMERAAGMTIETPAVRP